MCGPSPSPWLNPYANGPSPQTWQLLFSWFCMVLLVWACWFRSNRLLAGRLLDGAALAWVVAAGVSAVIGLLQYFGWTAWAGPWVNSTSGLGEAFANLRQRNQFASLTNLGLVALFWGWAYRDGGAGHMGGRASASGAAALDEAGTLARQLAQRLPAPVWQGACYALAALLAVANAATSSRTGLLQLVMLCAMALWWAGGQRRSLAKLVGVALLSYTLAAFLLPYALGVITGSSGGEGAALARFAAEEGCQSRVVLWKNVIYLIAQKPFIGWGWGGLNYAHFVTLYPQTRFCDILDNAHNLPLHLAVELGVPMAVLVCCLAVWLIWRAKPWAETNPTRQMAWGVLAVILLHSLLEYPLWYGPFQMAFGLAFWMLWRTPGAHAQALAQGSVPQGFGQLGHTIVGFIATLSIVFMAYLAWDYHRIRQVFLPPELRAEPYRENTLAKISDSRAYRSQVEFAALMVLPVTRPNAQTVRQLALSVVHFSPEAKVVEKLIQADVLLNNRNEALFYLVRYEAAFPTQPLAGTTAITR